MVKGISKQVIVVQSPVPRLFDQAIFILKDGAVEEGITDEALLKEARELIRSQAGKKPRFFAAGPLWACGGALVTGLVWLVSALV